MRKLVQLLILFSVSHFSFAQFTVAYTDSTDNVTSCGATETFTVLFESSNVIGSDIYGVLQFSEGVELESFTFVDPFDFISVDSSDLNNPVFFLNEVSSANDAEIVISIRAICGTIASDGSSSIVDTAYVTPDTSTSRSGWLFDFTSYSASTPVLNFGNFPTQTALIGDVVQRDIVVNNTGEDINGNFIITDDYGVSLRVDSAAVISGNVTNFIFTPNSAPNQARFTGSMNLTAEVPTMVIREYMFVDSCLFADNNTGGNSRIGMSYGCANDDTCATYSSINPSTANAIVTHPTNPSPAPLIEVSGYRGKDTNTCTNSMLPRTWIITNNGTSPAVNMNLRLLNYSIRDYISYSYVDAASVSATLNGASLVDSTTSMDNYYAPTTEINSKSCYDAAGHQGLHDSWFTIPELNVGDTIVLSFTEYRCCPDKPGSFGAWVARLTYGTACDPDPVSPAEVSYNSIPMEFKVTQEFGNFTNANMFGDTNRVEEIDTNLFVIDNIDLNFSAYGLNYPTLPLDTNNACFVVEIALDTGLYLVENIDPVGDLYITSPFGTYLPQSLRVDTILGTGNDYYTIIAARFCPPASFWDRNFVKDFFSSSSINFNLTARCKPKPPARSYIDHTLYLDLSTNCSNDCMIPMAFSSSFVQVQCPGCLIPGSLVGNSDLIRTNIGLEDADNNHLADDQITPASNAELREAVEGDTVENRFNVFFFDGQPDMGGWLYQQLQDTFGISFTHALVRKSFSDANFSLINADIEIIDKSEGATYSGTFVPREVSWGNLQGFDFNIETLLNEGIIDNNYTDFHVDDDINIVLRLKVVQQSHPDEGTVIELTNFFFTASDSLFINDAVDLDSLGLDTTILDSTYFFWCESRTGRMRLYDHELNTARLDNFLDNVSNDWCVKRIPVSSTYKVGAAGPNSDNFDFEYRHFTEVDRVKFVMPPGYEFVNASWQNTNHLRIPASALTTTQTNKVIDGVQPDTIIGDTLIFYAQQYFRDSAFFDNAYPFLLHGDENMILRLFVFISPKCGQAVDGEKRLEAFTYFDHPGLFIDEDTVRQHLITNPLNPGLTLPDPDLVRTPNDPQGFTVTISQSDVCIPFSILNNTSGSENFNAQNTFLFLDSAFLNTISNPSILDQNTNDTIVADSNGFYRLGNLAAGEARDLLICGQTSIDCDSDTTLATVYSGWSCIDYPTQFGSSICGVDSTLYKLVPTNASLSSELIALDTNEICDTVDMIFNVNAVGLGSNYGIVATLNLPSGVTYIGDSSYVVFAGDTIGYAHQPNGSGQLVWEMDSVNSLFITEGLSTTNFILSEFTILASVYQDGCSDLNQIHVNLISEKYCGDSVSNDVFIQPNFDILGSAFNLPGDGCIEVDTIITFDAVASHPDVDHEWYIAGALVDTTEDLTWQFSNTGLIEVKHKVSAPCCEDSTTTEIEVVEYCCPTLSMTVNHTPFLTYPGITVNYAVTIRNDGGNPANGLDLFTTLPNSIYAGCTEPISILNPGVLSGINVPAGGQVTVNVLAEICADDTVRGTVQTISFTLINDDPRCMDTVTVADPTRVLNVCPFLFTTSPADGNGLFSVSLFSLLPVDTAIDNNGCVKRLKFCISYPDTLMSLTQWPPSFFMNYPVSTATFDTVIADDSLYPYDSRKLLIVDYTFDGCVDLAAAAIDSIRFKLKCGLEPDTLPYVIQDGCGIRLWYDMDGDNLIDTSTNTFIDPAVDIQIPNGTPPCNGNGLRMEDTTVVTINPIATTLNFAHDPFTFDAKVKLDNISPNNNEVVLSNKTSGDLPGSVAPIGFEWYITPDGLPEVNINGQVYKPCIVTRQINQFGQNVRQYEPPVCGQIYLLDGSCHNISVVRQQVEIPATRGQVGGMSTREELVFYLDGVQVGRKVRIASSESIDNGATARWKIGNQIPYDLGLIGEIDHLRMWDISLSGQELNDLSDSILDHPDVLPLDYPVRADWTFNDDFSSQMVIDSTPYYHHGYLGTSPNDGLRDPMPLEEIDCNIIFSRTGMSNGNDTEYESNIKVWAHPNPYTHSTVLTIDAQPREKVNVRIYTIQGNELVLERNVVGSSQIMVGHELTSGVYIVRVETASENATMKLIKVE